jgi:DNA-binding response OmpR family regulator
MPKKILVVDDEVNIVKMLESRLKASGYEVVAAHDGQEGLDKARSEQPDLIILDLMMPKIDGYNVCRMLKFDDRYKHIPIMMVTAKDQESDVKLGFEVRADAYVTKPFDSKALLEKVKEFIG